MTNVQRSASASRGLELSRLGRAGLSSLEVSGFKSIAEKQRVDFGSLTLLAGANSSGKSSAMQPLLLLKQTLEASFDPGAVLLHGDNIKFTSSNQILSKAWAPSQPGPFEVTLSIAGRISLRLRFSRKKRLDVEEMETDWDGDRQRLRAGMTSEELRKLFPADAVRQDAAFGEDVQFAVVRDRCFLSVGVTRRPIRGFYGISSARVTDAFGTALRELIHLPGLRGNPERTYPTTAVGTSFAGTFETYTASVIAQWQSERNERSLSALRQDLETLGLTWKVVAEPVNEAQLQLLVGRLPHATRGGARDLVSLADVGVGVSQTLPVVVALHVAKPGQIVYLEQPEIHLHPRAQVAMAAVLARAAERGVRVIAETHSSLLLLGIQALVAEQALAASAVKLNWFARDSRGATLITHGHLDDSGAFGDWPEDFDDVSLEAQSRYMDAADDHLFVQSATGG